LSSSVPVLIIAFNRPSTLRVLLDRLAELGVREVYFAVDGPRSHRPEDFAKVQEVKALIDERFHPAKDHCLFQERNLGIRWAPPAAISWFFSKVEAGVILEDDCIPGESFFPFVQWALEKYEPVDQVKLVAGFNRFGESPFPESHRFIKTAYIWGWATWRRAWKDYDPYMARWTELDQRRKLDRWLGAFPVRDFWRETRDMVLRNSLVTWDVAWCWTVYNQRGLTVFPRVSLIQNIGFGEDATNTGGGASDPRSLIRAKSLPLPFVAPLRLAPDLKIQSQIDREEFWRPHDLVRNQWDRFLRRIWTRIRPWRPRTER
jgi:hypothetical protein